MDKSEKQYAEWKEPNTKEYCRIPFIWNREQIKLICDDKNEKVVVWEIEGN